MSSFLCPDTHISATAIGLFRWCERNHASRLDCLPDDCKSEGQSMDSLLAAAMHRLNCAALVARYGGRAEEAGNTFRFRRWERGGGTQALYKLTSCWLYQCSEGDCPETPLFQWVTKVKHGLADAIIAKLPGYKGTPWGLDETCMSNAVPIVFA